MSFELLDQALKALNAKADKEGWQSLPEGAFATIHVAKDGASLVLARIEAVRVEGDLFFARTPKKEQYAARRADVLAVAYDPGSSSPTRRAGF